MKKLVLVVLVVIVQGVDAATIRIQNSANKTLTGGIYYQGKTNSAQIDPGKSKLFTVLHGITGAFWQIDGITWEAPIAMKALEIKGHLDIYPNGKYDFSCLTCKKQTNQQAKEKVAAKINVPDNMPIKKPVPPVQLSQPSKPISSSADIQKLSATQLYELGMQSKQQRNFQKAIGLLDKAGSAGSVSAYVELSEMYGTGNGVLKDSIKAKKYADKAIELENKLFSETRTQIGTGL